MPSDSYNGKAWPDRREAMTIYATQSCCSSSMPWSARFDVAAILKEEKTKGVKPVEALAKPTSGLGSLVIWDLDLEAHIQSETHLSSPNNG
ncbi:unnamed protein product [Prunus brigantina]